MSVWLTIGLMVLFQLILALVLRTFPDFLGSALTKSVEHRFNLQLEGVKAEMQSAFSTLTKSVEFLSARQTEYRAKTIASVETLWNALLAIEKEFVGIRVVHQFMRPSDIDEALRNRDENVWLKAIGEYRDTETFYSKMERIDAIVSERVRPFAGDRLWLIFDVIHTIHARIASSMGQALQEGQYIDWYGPDLASALTSVLPSQLIEASKQQMNAPHELLCFLKAEFLKEARRVMSGSQGLAEALSDIQAAMQIEHAKLADARARVT